MKQRIPSLIAACALALVLPAGAVAQEADVELVTGGPLSAETLANMLYPSGLGSTRSIVMNDKPVVPKAVGLLIEFDFNSADIRPESQPYLDEVGRMLKLEQVGNRNMRIEGHADAIGSDEYNEKLSKRRADAVANYLVRKHDVSPDRLVVLGLGETKPLKDRQPTDPANRRVQFQAVE